MAYSFKGSINFALVYIPIKLEASISENNIGFNQLDRQTKSRIRYQKTCDACDGRIVEQKDIIKGYQYEGGKYVIFDDNDFEKIKTKKDKSITIERFVSLEEIDPIYFNKPYYVVPTGAEKAFMLLKEALESENKVGIAKTVLGTNETVIALRVSNGEMLLNTLYFKNEIKKNPLKEISVSLSKQELDLAKLIIKNMSDKFDPSIYKDEYSEKVRKAIEAKIAGRDITAAVEKTETISDLMEALQASVKNISVVKPSAKKSENASVKIKTTPQKKGAVKKTNNKTAVAKA